jgi:hypothetical protein
MIILEMADHGLDGSSASHLAANDFCDAADLAANLDPEPVGIVVAPKIDKTHDRPSDAALGLAPAEHAVAPRIKYAKCGDISWR